MRQYQQSRTRNQLRHIAVGGICEPLDVNRLQHVKLLATRLTCAWRMESTRRVQQEVMMNFEQQKQRRSAAVKC